MDFAHWDDHLPPAVLALADGSLFYGVAIGAPGTSVGEVVFNTAMTGYQEILTDPSYAEQLVTLTYPHIGNTGINRQDGESDRIQAKGLIIRDVPWFEGHWLADQSLLDYLRQQQTVAIAGIDTRRLTRLLRDHGAQHGCIMTGDVDVDEAIAKAKQFPGLQGMDLAKRVTTAAPYRWCEGVYDLDHQQFRKPHLTHQVVVIDFGVKRHILRALVENGCHVTVVPATSTVDEILACQPNGVVFSNGPGDPAACDYAIKTAQHLLARDIPLLGICLGFQILALACGAKTRKMKFGHHGANHPVQDCVSGAVMITSQNHGFAVDKACLPAELRMTHQSLFDGTLQGFTHVAKPLIAMQGHPEASPGPHDASDIFSQFANLMAKTRHAVTSTE